MGKAVRGIVLDRNPLLTMAEIRARNTSSREVLAGALCVFFNMGDMAVMELQEGAKDSPYPAQ